MPEVQGGETLLKHGGTQLKATNYFSIHYLDIGLTLTEDCSFASQDSTSRIFLSSDLLKYRKCRSSLLSGLMTRSLCRRLMGGYGQLQNDL
jgi:hypothetical protein